mmetsp:Transcript_12464/g.27542  ORF Transcript_12464/g.27542 Transcript_12464/m.27542 type:complete len:176 (+) Transcript_12464:48-575(+)|eukprot:CAMPEP_0204272800 /NCGR_PEP_ID=MMETSP0468-20130131/22288_1 /ASSEMBLY_ACC=CAM_ASM_000383 /TAXON_ID=2969 /ORGANISM="Oxyrrhis marina" /LENGTH=175 /DNA_ID=CAMNT_0051248683 /DNA_START=48 /DNA_END=575 /DNA_ORIENTATION=+
MADDSDSDGPMPEMPVAPAEQQGGGLQLPARDYGGPQKTEVVVEDGASPEVRVWAEKLAGDLDCLDIRGQNIGDSGAVALASALGTNRSLKSLDIGMNGIGTEGFKALAAALSKNSTLLGLDAYCNDMGDDGAVAMAEALKANATIKEVSLVGNKVSDESKELLRAAMEGRTIYV